MKIEGEVPEIYGDGTVEMQPLNTGRVPRSLHSAPRPAKKMSFLHSRWISLVLFFLFCLAISIAFLKLDNVQSVMQDAFSTQPKMDIPMLQERLASGRAKFRSILEADYGEYTEAVFGRENIMNSFHPPSDKSSNRLKRRMKIKLLLSLLSPPNTTVDFTWVSTGHSAAAGHGNLFNQTYSASIEAAAKVVFHELGINFYAKNYAMGGTASAPEIAMCLPEIVGKNVDVLSWDFGMTDGGASNNYALFTQRAGVLKSRPIVFDFEGFESHSEYNQFLDGQAAIGVFTIGLTGRDKLPKSDDENVDVEKLPPGIKYYMCGRHPEIQGDCVHHKWGTNPTCEPYGGVRFQVEWHNGWKDHLFIGRSIAAFLVEYLSDAIKELSEPPVDAQEPVPSLTKEYLNYLLQEESHDRDAFLNSPVPTNLFVFENIGAGNFSLFQRSNTVACHTARLPADSRFHGLVLESHVSTSYLYGGLTTYNSTSEGYADGHLPAPQQTDQELQPFLSYDYRAQCPFADIDAKDFFSVRDTDGWMKMIVPNPSEKAFYASVKDADTTHGFVLICNKQFDWGNGPDHFVSVTKVGNLTDIGEMSMTINGVNVTGSVLMDQNYGSCFAMSHEGGFIFPKSTNKELVDGQYEIRLRVLKPNSQAMISSVIVL